jgi:plastocyanin
VLLALIAVGALSVGPLGACSNNRESAQARAPVHTETANAKVAADGVQEVTITGNERFRFVPSTIKARPGPLRIVLMNSGTTPHDLEVEGAGQGTGLVAGGERAQITVNLKPGRYRFVCTLHIRLHMMGTIIVA